MCTHRRFFEFKKLIPLLSIIILILIIIVTTLHVPCAPFSGIRTTLLVSELYAPHDRYYIIIRPKQYVLHSFDVPAIDRFLVVIY
jgi:hypothetical protein